jgi:hypothetical protein
MRAPFSSHERLILFDFGLYEAGNLTVPYDNVNAGAPQPPNIIMSPMTPSGKRTTGFSFSIFSQIRAGGPPQAIYDVRRGTAVDGIRTLSPPVAAGYSITVWRFSNLVQRWAQFRQLTGIQSETLVVTSDCDASELFFQFDPATLAGAPAGGTTGALVMAFLEI